MATDFTPEQQALLDKQIADGEAAQKQIDAANSASSGPTAKSFSFFSSALTGAVRAGYVAYHLKGDTQVSNALKIADRTQRLEALKSCAAIQDIARKFQIPPDKVKQNIEIAIDHPNEPIAIYVMNLIALFSKP
jgi:hypothetical protein